MALSWSVRLWIEWLLVRDSPESLWLVPEQNILSSALYWFIPVGQEMVPTLLKKTVDWDVKHLHKQHTQFSEVSDNNSIFVGSHYYRRIHFSVLYGGRNCYSCLCHVTWSIPYNLLMQMFFPIFWSFGYMGFCQKAECCLSRCLEA